MKKIQILLLSLIAISTTAQTILWEKTLGGKHAEYLNHAIPTPDYGFIVAGSSLSDKVGDKGKNSEGDFDYFMAKLDEHANAEWTYTFGGDGIDRLQHVQRTPDGGYILAGTSTSGISGDKTSACIGQADIWVLKLDIKGEILWQKTLGGLGDERVSVVLQTADGGYLLGGSAASDIYTPKENSPIPPDVIYKNTPNKGNLDYWLVKLNAKGNLEWERNFGGKYVDELRSVVATANGFIVGGVSNSPQSLDKETLAQGNNDWWIIGLDNNGATQWQTSYATEGDDQLYSLVLTQDNHCLVGGNIGAYNTATKSMTADFLVLKLDLAGNHIWEKTYDVGEQDIMTNIVQNKDASFLISGYVTATKTKAKSKLKSKDNDDYFVLKIDANGKERWQKSVGTKNKEVLRCSIETRDGGYVLLGTSIKNGGTTADFWVVKLLDQEKPEHVKQIIEALPNPTLAYTSVIVGYDYAYGTVTVADLSGHVLQSFEIKGNRTIPVNIAGYSTGVYIVNVKTDVQSDGVKVLKVGD